VQCSGQLEWKNQNSPSTSHITGRRKPPPHPDSGALPPDGAPPSDAAAALRQVPGSLLQALVVGPFAGDEHHILSHSCCAKPSSRTLTFAIWLYSDLI